MKISVVLPAYNEEGSIEKLIEEIGNVLGKEVEVIVVDDNSSDKTPEIALRCGAKVIRNPYNMGNGASIKRGLRTATNPIVVLMDADGQHSPSQIPRLIKEMDGVDMVIAERKGCYQRWWRRLANCIYNLLASYVSNVKIKDLTSGFRVVKKDKAMKFLYLLPNRFSYPSILTLAFIKFAYPIKFVPIEVLPRKEGKSKINLINDGFRFLIIIARIAVFFSPLKLFLPLSLFFFFCGCSYYLYTFFRFHRFTNMSALFFTTSVIIFMLGLVSEQIVSLRMERVDSS